MNNKNNKYDMELEQNTSDLYWADIKLREHDNLQSAEVKFDLLKKRYMITKELLKKMR